MKFFGTDGIRGAVDGEIINHNFAHSFGIALGKFLRFNAKTNGTVLLGRDPRPSGKGLQDACGSGLQKEGFEVLDAGMVPTPALAFGVIDSNALLGVMVTASHNPHTDNGLKVFSQFGSKLSIEEEEAIESFIEPTDSFADSNGPFKEQDITGPYIKNLLTRFPKNILEGIKVVLDLANGATQRTTPMAFDSLGAQVILLNAGDGMINHDAGSECPQKVALKVIEEKADFGIAHDGDGDRVIFIDHSGQVVDGDKILGLLAKIALEKGELKGNSLVATVHSNSGIEAFLKQINVGFHRAEVGDRNVALEMKIRKCNWGGESSGHVVASDYLPTGDGLYVALTVAHYLVKTQTNLTEFSKKFFLWPSKSGAFPVKEKLPLEEIPILQESLAQCNELMQEEGRVLLRYSGTEPKIRLLVEGKSESLVDEVFSNLSKCVEKIL